MFHCTFTIASRLKDTMCSLEKPDMRKINKKNAGATIILQIKNSTVLY